MNITDQHIPAFDNTFVVVPAYNEAPVIRRVIEDLGRYFRNIVVVNDGSTDGTPGVLTGLQATLLSHAVNLGQGAALQTGITYALSKGAAWVVTFDADGQHRVEDALAMLKELQAGTGDAIVGSRFLGGTVNMPWSRKAALRAAVCVSNLRRKNKLTDIHNGLRVLSRRAAQVLDISQNGMAHASEVIRQLTDHGMNIREVPVIIRYSDYSLRKGQSLCNALNIMVDLLVRRFLK